LDHQKHSPLQRFLKIFLMTGLPYGLCTGLLGAIALNFVQSPRPAATGGLFLGAASGLAFGFCMAVFSAIQQRRFAAKRPDFGGERVLHEGPANHFHRGAGTGGRLYLTAGRLFFKSHRFNRHPHKTTLRLSEIAEARPVKTAGVLPNGLKVVTSSGHSERFVVEHHKKWSAAINRAKQAA
jgi:hypothetical protein